LKAGIIFGGPSPEHEVSVVSARCVMAAIDRGRFRPIPIGISKEGCWLTPGETEAALGGLGEEMGSLPDVGGRWRARAMASLANLDVAFPLVHGPYGEDGTLQGLLEMVGLPYVGCGVAASALGMDKALQKAVFRQVGLPVVDYQVITAHQWHSEGGRLLRQVEVSFPYPLFVKPANGGSSIAVSKANTREELAAALDLALRYDRKALVERAIQGREVECAVLGNEEPQASPLGEIIPAREFYDYKAKYLDPHTRLVVPVALPRPVEEEVHRLAVAAFRAIDGAGMARVDFFITKQGRAYINEVNTIPGFTPISMYPKLWETAGLSYKDLIGCLIELALERHRGQPGRAGGPGGSGITGRAIPLRGSPGPGGFG